MPPPDGNVQTTMLLVADEQPLRSFMPSLPAKVGYSMITPVDGMKVLGSAGGHNGRIDPLLSDVEMPRIKGVEFATEGAGASRQIRQTARPSGVQMSKSDYTERPMPKVLATVVTGGRPLPIRPQSVPSEAHPERCRRTSIRYPIATPVVYHLMKEQEMLAEGQGRSINMSSGGILLHTDTALPAGVGIELRIAWPAKLDQHVALTLNIGGRTMRSEGNHTAVAILRYEFRTRRKAVTTAEDSIALI